MQLYISESELELSWTNKFKLLLFYCEMNLIVSSMSFTWIKNSGFLKKHLQNLMQRHIARHYIGAMSFELGMENFKEINSKRNTEVWQKILKIN